MACRIINKILNRLGGIMEIRIKYFDGGVKLKKISQGDWIDVYAAEDIFIPQYTARRVRLGFALELPEGYEAHLLPRSSTFKTWGVVMTNSMGIIDNSYCGDNDEWSMELYCCNENDYDGILLGTHIHKGDKLGQFRIMESMPEIIFKEVDKLGNKDRGGYGTTGTHE